MTRSNRLFAHVLGLATLLAAPLSLLAGCTVEEPPNAGDAAPPKDDAAPPKDDVPAPKPDATPDVIAVDTADGGCSCDPGDAQFGVGFVSLACYCDGTFGQCPSYQGALANCAGGSSAFSRLEEYADCNFAVITTGGPYGGTKYAYNYKTQQLVGASRSTDYPAYACGSTNVFGYNAGQFPAATCVKSRVVERCSGTDGGDAGPFADVNDGGCACSRVDDSTTSISLPCFCGGPSGSCPSYDAALAICQGTLPEFNRVEEYGGCNLTVITRGRGLGGTSYAYDSQTRELVGVRRFDDTGSFSCGSERFSAQIAGRLPDASCVQTKLVYGCGSDGGDAGWTDARDVTPDTGDGGCICDPGDGGFNGAELTLACFCSRGNDLCRSYDATLAECWGALPEFSHLEEYADCNLAVITNGWGLGGTNYVYDYTTHALVGASIGSDVPEFTCGTAHVFGYRAGSFPAPSCVKTNVVTRCTRDGGDAAPGAD